MKKTHLVISTVAFSFLMASCSQPDFCECIDNDMRGAQKDEGLSEKCEDAYSDHSKEEIKELVESCNPE